MNKFTIWLSLILLLTCVHAKPKEFSACMDYVLTGPNFDFQVTKKFTNLKDVSTFLAVSDSSHASDLANTNVVSCSSTYMNKVSWGLKAPYSTCASKSPYEYGFGLWVKFLSTLGTDTIMIGDLDTFAGTYKISSTTEGTLSFTYAVSSSSIDADDFQTDVPLNSWTLLTLYWVGSTFKVFMPGHTAVSKTAKSGFTFAAPNQNGNIFFGKSVQAYFYELIAFQIATLNAAVITLNYGTGTYTTGTCPVGCADSYCISGQYCISSYSYCSSCDSTGCLACGSTIRDPATYCNSCLGGFCCASNCDKCSSATVCTSCQTGYFLYDKGGSTTCVSCKDSCANCEQSPSCFNCADFIVKDGSSCRVDSIGYQISFASPNIEIDFAHPIKAALAKKSIIAIANDGSGIDTSAWSLSGCDAGVISCKIVTNNVSENKLPLDFDFDFANV